MKNLFSVGEVAKQQNISKQTLIYYDKIGLFSPAYVDPDTGYRFYSAAQLDYLDTILIMKRIGFSLKEIREHMKNYTIDSSLAALRKQITVIERQIGELRMIRSRVEHRCSQMEKALSACGGGENVIVENADRQFILSREVDPPFSLENISLATKQCFVRSFAEQLPIYYQSGVIVPYRHILEKRYTEAVRAFLPIEETDAAGVTELPAGKCVCTYHIGDYLSVGRSYERILGFCRKNRLEIISDSYEFCVNDYLSARDENEYITKIMFYIRDPLSCHRNRLRFS